MNQPILDEASYAAATELARLQGGTVQESIAGAVRAALIHARSETTRRDASNSTETREEQDRQARAWLARWHELLGNPPPLSDHSRLYDDETGLPV